MNSLLNLSKLLDSVKGTQISKKNECFFTSVQTDSRNVVENTLFVPLMGEVQNGHKYIPAALEKGASVVFVNKAEYDSDAALYEKYCAEYPQTVFIKVENTLHALQNAAEEYVNQVAANMIRVCITGSSGKTTTKEMMVSVCREYFGEENICYTKGNFNSETGLPLSVFNIKGSEKIGIFEMGMNRKNEIGEISRVWKAQYGIITNIGTAHIGILGSRENIAAEKRKAFDYIPENGAAFVPEADDFADFCLENVKGKKIKFGSSIKSEINGIKFVSDNGFDGTSFLLDGVLINLPLNGKYNFENALGVIACCKKLGIGAETIRRGLENMPHLDGRMEKISAVLNNDKKVTLLKDCYNANLDSMSKAIDFVCGLNISGRKILVLGDMKELGSESKKAHTEIGRKIAEKNPFMVILIGCEMKAAYEYLKKNNWENRVIYLDCSLEEYVEKTSEELLSVAENEDVVLLKGSHSMSLEKIIPCIEKNSVKKDGQ